MRQRILFGMQSLLVMALSACAADAPECLRAAGDRVRETVEVSEFSAITVFDDIELVVMQGTPQRVEIETGANLRPDIHAEVQDGTLRLRNGNGCNLFREYGLTTVYVTVPDLRILRSSTGLPVRSQGVLGFEDLQLISESFNDPEAETTDGSFELTLATGRVRITANGIAYFQLSGTTGTLGVTIAAGDSRVEANALLADRVNLDHRGSNEILVNPRHRISGRIRGYGDVLSYNRPDTVEVEELFRGRLIFVP